MGLFKRALDGITNGTRKATRRAKKDAKTVGENAVSVFLSGAKKIFKILILPIIIKLLVIIILLAAAWEVVSGLAVTTSFATVSSFISSSQVSSSLEEQYELTGSLVSATDTDIIQMASDYNDSIRKGELSYLYDYFNSTVPNKVTNNSGVYLETSTSTDPIDLGEDFTLYEHILNTERYNFNRITWGRYTRGVKQEGTPTLTVDSATRLQYPKDSEYNLDNFITMARPYLQSWIIPLSMMSGIASNATDDKFANFAYANISEGYHKIQIDQHSLDTKTRVNNYRIYDKTTTIINIERTCTKYKSPEAAITEVCVDVEVEQTPTLEKDIRENISSTDSIGTEYNYVLTSVKALDSMITNVYNVEQYYVDNNVYNEDLAKTTSHMSEEQVYYQKEEIKDSSFKENNKKASDSLDFSKLKKISSTKETLKYKTIVEKNGKTYQDTLVWKDKLEYNSENSSFQKGYTVQQLKEYLGTGVQLTVEEEEYYSDLEYAGKLNLIDFLNAKESVYKTYVVLSASKNLGYNRSYLATSYDVLKKNLSETYSKYKYSIGYGQSIVPTIEYKTTTTATYDYSWLSEGSFGWPVPGNYAVAYVFGTTRAYSNNPNRVHRGIDLWPDPNKGAYQTDIVAAKAGKVIIANDLKYPNVRNEPAGWGNYIKIDHGNNVYTLYAHLNTGSFKVSAGEYVEAGQVIAHMGSSGNSTGEHLHFELYNGNERVDPLILYNVKPNENYNYPEYDMLTEDQKYNIIHDKPYFYVSSK